MKFKIMALPVQDPSAVLTDPVRVVAFDFDTLTEAEMVRQTLAIVFYKHSLYILEV